jgi:hypothetical protein
MCTVHFASLLTRHIYSDTWFQTWFYGFPRKRRCDATTGNSCSKAYIFSCFMRKQESRLEGFFEGTFVVCHF